MIKFLSLSVVFSSAVVAMAGATEITPQLSKSLASVKEVVTRSAETDANQVWYGYYKGNEPISAFGVGMPNITAVDNAIFVNGADPICKGKKIVGLRFIIQGKGEISDISGWLSPELNIPVDENLIVSVPVAEEDVVDAGWTVVFLPEPVLIPEEGVYAGYTVHTTGATHEAQFIGFTTSDRIAPDGALYSHESPFMSGWQSYGDRMGKLCYQVLLEGEFVENAVTVGALGDYYVVKGEKVNVPLTLTNLGSNGIESIDYIVTTNDVEGELMHYVLDQKFDVFGGSTVVTIALDSDSETAYASKELKIVNVNGKPNEAVEEETVAKGGLVTLSENSPRKAVAETYTGTWCGWCPRALVGNEKLSEIYGSDFIAIEAHVGMMNDTDPMSIAAYDELKDDRRGYPCSVFNREYAGDPYAGLSNKEEFTVPEVVEMILSSVAEGSIEVTASWANSDQTRIKASSDIVFQYNSEDVHYAVAYVLKANGLKGSSVDWMQANYYCYFAEDAEYQPGTELYDDFEFFLKSDELIPDMEYNDVAVAAYGLAEGLSESVAPFASGIAQTHEYTISIANNDLVQDKNKLSVVALLIDTQSGKIVNASEAMVSSSVGVEAISGNDAFVKEVSRHDLLGRRIEAPVKGINVITYSDGSVKKVMVK